MANVPFPADFLWGTATAAYQIEGAVDRDGKGPSIWDTFTRLPGKVLRGDTGDIACDHYDRWQSDLDLLSELGVNSYRFSIAWSRVLPTGRGAVNEAGLDFYDRLIDGLVERNIKPVVTLYHWDLPEALQELGGWANRDTSSRFVDYARVVASRFDDRVSHWLTLNEPWVAAFEGNLLGTHAPGLTDEATAITVAHHLLLAHGLATQALRADGATGKLGITCNLTSPHPASGAAEDVAAAKRLDLFENRVFLDPLFRGAYPEDMPEYYAGISDLDFIRDGDLETISTPIDYFGVNYYQRHLVAADPADPIRGWKRLPDTKQTAVGIGVHPEGLYEILTRVSRDYTDVPLIVAETGIALHDYTDPEGEIRDVDRVDFYDGHLRAAHRAIEDGVKLSGFFPWSFLDNFEWAGGYAYRYGMYYVDYPTQVRTPKWSATWYAKVTRAGGLD
jgi:beta-glucosidase